MRQAHDCPRDTFPLLPRGKPCRRLSLRQTKQDSALATLRQMRQAYSPNETANLRQMRQPTYAERDSRSALYETGIAVQVLGITAEFASVLFVPMYLNKHSCGLVGGRWTR